MALRTLTKWLLGVALALGMTSLQTNTASAPSSATIGVAAGRAAAGVRAVLPAVAGDRAVRRAVAGVRMDRPAVAGDLAVRPAGLGVHTARMVLGVAAARPAAAIRRRFIRPPWKARPMMTPGAPPMPAPTTAPPAPGKSAFDIRAGRGIYRCRCSRRCEGVRERPTDDYHRRTSSVCVAWLVSRHEV